MERYKKANEGIHAPDRLKKAAAKPRNRKTVGWVSAVAAVLAVAILGGILLHPGSSPVVVTANAAAIYEATYPEMPRYPSEDKILSGEDDYDKWWQARRERRTALEGVYQRGGLTAFHTATMAQFLSDSGSENRVYSPLNVYMALAMLAETAGGESRQQVLDLLGVGDIEAVRRLSAALWNANYCDDGAATSIPAASLWLNKDVTYVDKTMKQLADTYHASSYRGEMGSAEFDKALQDWLNEQTGGLLQEAAGEVEMPPETILALAATLYYKVRWDSEFSPNRNTKEVFHTPNGSVTAEFMHQSGTGAYYWGEKFSAIQRSFVEGGSMWLILPDEGATPDELLRDSEAMAFMTSESKYDWEKQKCLMVNQSIPKFDVTSTISLTEGLKALGVTDVFDARRADFSPMTEDVQTVVLSQATHSARVMIDEEGCTAAAFTVMLECGADMPPEEEVDFVLDRPFLFLIESETNQLLFTGVVNQP
ncbi:MAG: serpin family protein [Oscillospiraceae bacterium]|nr:serpin family protein [Oscillospiraceae bacterium]